MRTGLPRFYGKSSWGRCREIQGYPKEEWRIAAHGDKSKVKDNAIETSLP
ncbi:hypothetical protein PORCRE_1505 [Porphyromonas crevioricanis JCM 15906]|uniref:Uncharacterized protein n=1 Tax=Porphyromonas crevioricanis JCM 15906 TaxID=1305617 RepID=T1CPN4_9PORP|nr:hypothetical protein PORCRE_1505 [Porphyromonas crevioricanis JCM 15906]